jgi:hypothetical protein
MQENYRKFNDRFANELRQMSKFDSRKFLNILNRYSESRTDLYSSEIIHNLLFKIAVKTLPIQHKRVIGR